MTGIELFITNILGFLNDTIIPLILAIALLVFIWNIAYYFIIVSGKAGNKDKGVASGQEKARTHALWGIIAFVVIVSLWGVINLLVSSLGFDRNDAINPDYLEQGGRGYDLDTLGGILHQE
jgi:hypothetical protein